MLADLLPLDYADPLAVVYKPSIARLLQFSFAFFILIHKFFVCLSASLP